MRVGDLHTLWIARIRKMGATRHTKMLLDRLRFRFHSADNLLLWLQSPRNAEWATVMHDEKSSSWRIGFCSLQARQSCSAKELRDLGMLMIVDSADLDHLDGGKRGINAQSTMAAKKRRRRRTHRPKYRAKDGSGAVGSYEEKEADDYYGDDSGDEDDDVVAEKGSAAGAAAGANGKDDDPEAGLDPAQKQRYAMAKMLGEMVPGFDTKLIVLALEQAKDNPDEAMDLLLTGGAQVSALKKQAGGTSVTFTTPEPFFHSSPFTLKFALDSSTVPWKRGEWVALYREGQDEGEVGTSYMTVSKAAHQNGVLEWRVQYAPKEPGVYYFCFYHGRGFGTK